MRKIVVYELLSLDGVAEAPDTFFGWDDATDARAGAAGVVDELSLAIGPMNAGRGRRLLDDLPPIRLELIRSETSPTGNLLVDYRVLR